MHLIVYLTNQMFAGRIQMQMHSRHLIAHSNAQQSIAHSNAFTIVNKTGMLWNSQTSNLFPIVRESSGSLPEIKLYHPLPVNMSVKGSGARGRLLPFRKSERRQRGGGAQSVVVICHSDTHSTYEPGGWGWGVGGGRGLNILHGLGRILKPLRPPRGFATVRTRENDKPCRGNTIFTQTTLVTLDCVHIIFYLKDLL